MSSLISTPAALSSSARPYAGPAWRVVEAQHIVSTLKLVDTLAEQALLEELLETSKPALPPDCAGLDYLLATPFRYGAVYPHGSRFRRAGKTLGVFYAAEVVDTALAEMAFYRLLFFAESPATSLPSNATDYTAFMVGIGTARSVDLTIAPLSGAAADWTDPVRYEACQGLADMARSGDIDVIRYQSVRDPQARANLAVLSCAAFAERAPSAWQSWKIRINAGGVQAICEFPRRSLDFRREQFVADPRILPVA